MELDKRIAEQMQRIEALQKEVIGREPSAEDADRTEALKRSRAATVRETIASLETRKKETVARFDAEIAACRAELASLERTTDLDNVLRRVDGTLSREGVYGAGAGKSK